MATSTHQSNSASSNTRFTPPDSLVKEEDEELAALGGGSILAGHSLGASLLLKYLCEEKVETSVAGLFLIAPPY